MSQGEIASAVNAFLDPKIFQVIGSTPTSLRDHVKSANFKGKKDLGIKFMALSVFASAVNKGTMEGFLSEDGLGDLRALMSREFYLNNKPNMTALSLAGHCFVACDLLSEVTFVKAYRNKMGQGDIWAGDFGSGSISDKQKAILKEKAKVHKKEECVLFANCFLKWCGVSKAAMTGREFAFWADNTAPTGPPEGGDKGERAEEQSLAGVGWGRYVEDRGRAVSSSRAAGQVTGFITENDGMAEVVLSNNDKLTFPEAEYKYWTETMNRTADDLLNACIKNGCSSVLKNIQFRMRGGGGSLSGAA
jgi:hypothetical protein